MFKWIKSFFLRRQAYAISTSLLRTYGGELRVGTKAMLIVKVGNNEFPVFDPKQIEKVKALFNEAFDKLGVDMPIFFWNHAIDFDVLVVGQTEPQKVVDGSIEIVY